MQQHCRWDADAELARGSCIGDEFNRGDLLDRNVGWPGAAQDFVDQLGLTAVLGFERSSIAEQAASFHRAARAGDNGQVCAVGEVKQVLKPGDQRGRTQLRGFCRDSAA